LRQRRQPVDGGAVVRGGQADQRTDVGRAATAASTWCAATSTCPPCSSSPIFSDEELAGALRAVRLAPLQRLRPAQQDRLAETLLAWLQHGYNAYEVA